MRVLLVLFGLTVGLLLAEGGSRIVDRLQCRNNPGMFWEPNRWVGWTHTPDARGWAQQCLRGKIEWRVYTRINGHGLRDRDIPYERQRKFRILVLGDSFTEGMQVEQDETFPKLLEQRLGNGVEVLNAGVAAYGTDSELLFWEREGWKYRPDLVLLPLLNGRSGYSPPLMARTMPLANRLPDPDALAQLRQLTAVRWVLVHCDHPATPKLPVAGLCAGAAWSGTRLRDFGVMRLYDLGRAPALPRPWPRRGEPAEGCDF